MKITKRGRYTTRDGRKVRIYAVDGGAGWPVHGAVFSRESGWIIESWEKGGSLFRTGECDVLDLIPAPKRKRGK